MKFWLYVAASTLLIPLTMLVVGRVYEKAAPKRINHITGYRTAMSMKNRDTWEFAHHYIGRLWKKWSIWMFIGSAAAMLVCLDGKEAEVGLMGGLIAAVQTTVMCISIVMTERALKNTFDKYGLRK